MAEEPKLPTRSAEFGVGKRIGGSVYVHRSYEEVLGDVVQTAKRHLPDGFDYTVIKYNQQTSNVSFIQSPDFDDADEPSVGDSIVVHADGTTKTRPGLADPHIYHHKWLFVSDDYKGFDVEQSRARSRAWLSLDNVDKSRIGRASYWNKHVVPRLGC